MSAMVFDAPAAGERRKLAEWLDSLAGDTLDQADREAVEALAERVRSGELQPDPRLDLRGIVSTLEWTILEALPKNVLRAVAERID